MPRAADRRRRISTYGIGGVQPVGQRKQRVRRWSARAAALLVVALTVLHALPAVAVQYQINFVDGTELRTSRVRQVGNEIQYEKFGGEASVSVDEVASVYVVESDGTVSWVMQPRREGSTPARNPAAAPVAKERMGPSGSPRSATKEATPGVPKDQGPTPGVVPTENAVAVQTGGPDAGPGEGSQGKTTAAVPSPTAEAPGDRSAAPSSSSAAAPAPRSGKVILKPAEPLAKRLLRWGGAPLAALLVLGAVLMVFRRKFRAGEQGVPVTAAVGEGGQREVDFSAPAKSWDTLVLAIEERDIDVYRLCWQQSYSDEDLNLAFQKILMNWKYYDYSVVKAEPHASSKERFYLHVKRSTKFAREDLEERVRRVSLLLTDGGWKFEELPFGF
jgi:hypothetical protein